MTPLSEDGGQQAKRNRAVVSDQDIHNGSFLNAKHGDGHPTGRRRNGPPFPYRPEEGFLYAENVLLHPGSTHPGKVENTLG
jgi:hypothetical protein